MARRVAAWGLADATSAYRPSGLSRQGQLMAESRGDEGAGVSSVAEYHDELTAGVVISVERKRKARRRGSP